MSEVKKFSTEFCGRTLTIETGRIAKQTNASCTVQYGETVVLATVVMSKDQREGIDFFPLSVEYEERLYAAGKIKGSRWVKREGRPSEEAVLSGRMIDRAIRPLFPQGVRNDVQIVLTVLSYDAENDSNIVALIAASAALTISDIPWAGPLAGVKVGRVEGKLVFNPTPAEKEKSDLDLVVAGLNDKVLMLEAGAKQIPEAEMYEAIAKAMEPITVVQKFLQEIQTQIGKVKLPTEFFAAKITAEQQAETEKIQQLVATFAAAKVEAALFSKSLDSKSSRKEAIAKLDEELAKELIAQGLPVEKIESAQGYLYELIEGQVTENILKHDRRVDGRLLTDVRVLVGEVSILPRTHGSAIFSRGETQVLSLVTLGSPGDEQQLEGLEENGKKRYMHHYNFPPYSVGEIGRLGSPGRREIGHGDLAERALVPVLPTKEQFPYTIRVVSEVMGSNGSSSMASTCGSTLSLMDAGVPITAPVAGVAMGLASDGKGQFKVLTDLQDLEDGTGGMDFKITGTSQGITAIQLDTKTDGLPLTVVKQTLEQAKPARQQILELITKTIPTPRLEMSKYAPRIITFSIPIDKIRDVIGPGGKMINEIIDETGVTIDIEQDGMVYITSANAEAAVKAQDWIKNITREVVAGEVYQGTITRMLDFGAFAEILPKQEGLIHVSELAWGHVNRVTDVVQIGDVVPVKVLQIDDQGRINLSRKALIPKPEGYIEEPPMERPRRFDRNSGSGGQRPFRR
ncbi:MAG: polyribonucleotide nucleotidyltransferase [Candidatus Buchananbacteria bacterium]